MPRSPFELKLTGSWKKLALRVDERRLKRATKTNVRRATMRNAMLAARAIRARIRQKKYEPNAPLTEILKRSKKPLVDTGDLWGAITHESLNPTTAMAGVISQTQSLRNLAIILHEGATIPVSTKMRNLFRQLFFYTHGHIPKSALTGRAAEIAERLTNLKKQKVYPLKPTTQAIKIPGRPFIQDVVEDAALMADFKKNWEAAVDGAFHGRKG